MIGAAQALQGSGEDFVGDRGEKACEVAIDGNKPKPPAVARDASSWLHVALGEIGTREIPGPLTNPRIAEYYKSTNLGGLPEDSATPWCSAFCNWVMEHAGYRTLRRANAKSWLGWGMALPLAEPRIGAITVLWRGDPAAETGHVAFYGGAHKDQVWLFGGNQNNEVGWQLYGTGRVVGYRWPRDIDRKG